jgi:metallopeptidase MepB
MDFAPQIARSKKVQDDVVAAVTPEKASFDAVVLPMARDDNKLGVEFRILEFYQAVSTDKDLRDASSKAEKDMDDFAIESSMREDLFKLVDAVLKKKEKLDPESQRLLEKEHKMFVRNGLNVPAGPKRDRFKEIKKRISELQIEFQKTLNEENGGLWLTTEELDGVPDDVVSNLKKGEGENEGKLWLTFKYPDLFPTLKYATNATVREKYFVANENKANSNAKIFKEVIILRDEAARILGYPNHAAFRIEEKMMKTPEAVNEFLGDLKERLLAGGDSEKKKLIQIKEGDLKARNKSSEVDGKYYLWDHRFYDRMMLEKDYSLDLEKISEWFPIHNTINGMLRIFEEIFGLVFVEVVGADRDAISPTGKGNDIVWHEDVQIFSVWDDEGEGSGFVGYLYLDLFPRDGKYGHAANFNLGPGYIDENGKRRYPATALVCNFSKPKPNKPSLLKHNEVVTLFHELGHGIHDLVSRTIYSRFHGTSTVRDFVEAPSQMLENWCWTPSQIKSLSKHYSYTSSEYAAAYSEKSSDKPSETIPDDLVDRLIKTKHVNDALANLRQLHFGIFDMTIHTPKNHDEITGVEFGDLYNKLRSEIASIDGMEVKTGKFDWGHGEATFGHLIGGYDAGYYGYLRYERTSLVSNAARTNICISSQVYSTDMFYSVFAKDPMNAKEGRRYRHTVLERGGSQDEMTTLEEFLGRKPSPEAFYKELGVA